MGRKEDGPLNGQLFMIYRLHFYFPLSGASLLGERLLLFTKIFAYLSAFEFLVIRYGYIRIDTVSYIMNFKKKIQQKKYVYIYICINEYKKST